MHVTSSFRTFGMSAHGSQRPAGPRGPQTALIGRVHDRAHLPASDLEFDVQRAGLGTALRDAFEQAGLAADEQTGPPEGTAEQLVDGSAVAKRLTVSRSRPCSRAHGLLEVADQRVALRSRG